MRLTTLFSLTILLVIISLASSTPSEDPSKVPTEVDKTQIAMDKLFGVEEDPVDSEALKEQRRKEDLERDEFMFKIVLGVAIFVGILFVLSKFLMKNYAADNVRLKEEQERLEGEFYERFNKKKKHT